MATPASPLHDCGSVFSRISDYCGDRLLLGKVFLELLCGLTVPLALIPEAIGFAFTAHVTPYVALTSAWIMCAITSLVGGRPAMVSGYAGSVAVVAGDVVKEHGIEYGFYAVMLMGFIQVLLGALKADKLVRLLPCPVMIGFCNGLAIIIFRSQLDNFKEPGSEDWVSGVQAAWTFTVCGAAFLTSMFFPKLTNKVPSSLLAVLVASVMEWCLIRPCGFHTTIVSDLAPVEGSLPTFVWMDKKYDMPSLGVGMLGDLIAPSCFMAIIGLIESCLTLSFVDELTQTHGNTRQECLGQGFANLICGFFGGMGGCGMLGQTMVNVISGGRTRLSTFTSGIFLLVIMLLLSPFIGKIPMAGLAGVMFNVCVLTFEWRSLGMVLFSLLPANCLNCFSGRHLRVGVTDAITIVIVTVIPQMSNLAVAVIVGVVLSAISFVQEIGPTISCVAEVENDPAGNIIRKTYTVQGRLFFGSRMAFLEQFDACADPADVVLRFGEAMICDFSGLEALNALGERYANLGKRVTVESIDSLQSRQLLGRGRGLLAETVTYNVRFSMPSITPEVPVSNSVSTGAQDSRGIVSLITAPRQSRPSLLDGALLRPSLPRDSGYFPLMS